MISPYSQSKTPLISGSAIYILVGYALYFFARIQLEPPDWASNLVEQLMPIVKALKTAARVNAHPFPAQAVILYCAFGSLVLTGWFTYWLFLIKEIRDAYRKSAIDKKASRLKLSVIGVCGLFFIVASYPLILFILEPTTLGWRDVARLSPTMGSITCLLVSSFLPAIFFPLALCCIYSAITTCKQRT